jgi:hypothetical protein
LNQDLTNITQIYLSNVSNRLVSAGFQIIHNKLFCAYSLSTVASSTKLQVEKFGMTRTVIAFSEFDKPDIYQLKKYSSCVYKYTNKWFGLIPPRGLFFTTECYAVAIVNIIDDQTIETIKKMSPPKHFSSSEILVILNLNNQSLYYYLTNPPWGIVYHDQRREFIKTMLSPIEHV